MRAGAQARTVFAGFGVSGSLLAAVGAILVIGGGVMAFDAVPRLEGPSPERALEVAAARAPSAPPAAQAPVLALPSALPAAAASAPGGAPARARDAATPGGPEAPGRPPAGPGAPTLPPGPPAPAPGAGPAQPPPGGGPVPDLVGATRDTAAGTLRGVGRAVPLVAPVTDALADVVGGAARGLLPLSGRSAAGPGSAG